MSLDKNSVMHDVAVENRDSIISEGNPIYNKFYKNMKPKALLDHLNFASETSNNNNWDWDSREFSEFDIIIDDGHIEARSEYTNRSFNYWSPKVLTPYSTRNNLEKYQPYFKPTGKISDFAVAHSTGIVGLKYPTKMIKTSSIAYSDYYNDKDLNCVTVLIDVGKNCDVTLDEKFFNKDGLKIYKIVYLVRDYASLTIERKFDIDAKDSGANIIESRVIQFPNSKFNYKVTGEGSKYTQDLMYIDVYESCNTDVRGSFDLYGDYINNSVIDVHHIGPDSTSRVDIRSIIDDQAHSSFLGSIIVDKEAEGTDAELVNKNLLVSNTASAITEPQLDIHTKEIACSHGCTVSNIDVNQLYFLQSRGIETNIAEETLKQCFLKM
jgi:hypothetical protein